VSRYYFRFFLSDGQIFDGWADAMSYCEAHSMVQGFAREYAQAYQAIISNSESMGSNTLV
jgi:hypothetical protein